MRSTASSTPNRLEHDASSHPSRRGATSVLRLRAATRGVASQLVETLEARQLLAVSVFNRVIDAGFTPTSDNAYDVKHGPLAKGGGTLVSLFKEYSNFVKNGGDKSQFKSRLSDVYAIEGRNVLVTMQTKGKIDALSDEVHAQGGTLVYRSKSRGLVEAYIPIASADNIASQKQVLHIRPAVRAVSASVGSVVNDAETSQKSKFVIPAFGVDGTGQTVGVISDSYGDDTASVFSGDLPANVKVLNDTPGTDEGRAMLELVHDVAPGAALQFSTGSPTQDVFAQSVRGLREAGSTVIVDDISFATEPYFGEGIIDKAINDVHDDGAMYFTAQRNSGFAGYSAKTNWVKEEGGERLAVDFDPGKGVDTKLGISIKEAGYIFLQWDNPYDGSVADVTADVDFYLYRKGTLIASSTDDNFATGIPFEALPVLEKGSYEIVMRLNKLAKGATLPTMFKFSANGNDPTMFDARTDVEFPGYDSSAVGHSAARGAIPVAAVDNANTEAFGVSRNFSNEDFSSGGPVVRIFDPNGNRLAKPVVVLAPLFSAPQRTATSVPGFESFAGTSAASPNAAATAALLRDLSPTSTPDQVRDAMVVSAKTQPLNGAAPGEWDPQGGYGLIDAVVAAKQFNPGVGTSSIVLPATATSLNSITVNFSKAVTGVDIGDFTLTRDGTSRSRFTGGETVVSSNGGKTWTIQNLASATNTLGSYTLTLKASGTGIVDSDNNPVAGDVGSFDVTLRKVRSLKIDKLDDGKILLRWTDSNSREDSYRIERSTASDFSENVRKIDAPANAKSYTDADVTPGEVYFYRVRAQKGGKLGDTSTVSIVDSSVGEIFVDQAAAKFSGSWKTDADAGAFFDTKARASETLADGKANTATFTSSDIATGAYFVYARYTDGAKNASNATYQVLSGSSVIGTVKVDQTTRGGGWVLLGKFANAGEGLSVRLTSAGADGTVVADAVQFLPANETTIANFQKLRKAKRKAAASVVA